MEHYFDLEEVNAEMAQERIEFINEFRRFLSEKAIALTINKFNELQVSIPEQKSGSQIFQHAQTFSIGEFPISEYTI